MDRQIGRRNNCLFVTQIDMFVKNLFCTKECDYHYISAQNSRQSDRSFFSHSALFAYLTARILLIENVHMPSNIDPNPYPNPNTKHEKVIPKTLILTITLLSEKRVQERCRA